MKTLRRLTATTLTAALLTAFAPSSTATADAPGPATAQAPVAMSASEVVEDADGNLIPPPLNSHVDQWCDNDGDGTDGPRIQMLFIRSTSDTMTSAQVAQFEAELREEARYIDDAFAVAAAENGSGRRVRWAHDGACNITIPQITLTDSEIGANADVTTQSLKAKGLLTTNRLYLGFTTKPEGTMASCGWTSTADPTRLSDGSTIQFARIDHLTSSGRSCHSVEPLHYDSTALHELIHIMGALNPDAPHSGEENQTHCTDGYDALCGPSDSGAPKCEAAWVIDCGKDDYFNASPNSTLPAHMNIANSVFLATVPRLPVAPTVTLTTDNPAPAEGDVVTFTVQTESGVRTQWSVAECEEMATPAEGATTYSVQCLYQSTATVSVRVWRPGQPTVTKATRQFAVSDGGEPTVTITGPTQATPGQQVTLNAVLTNAPGDWTYDWFPKSPEGCQYHSGTTGAQVVVSCAENTYTNFFVDAQRIQDGAYAASPTVHTLEVRAASAGTMALSLTGPSQAASGTAFNVAALTESGAAFNWTSSMAACAVSPYPGDRSVVTVTCQPGTFGQLAVGVTATAADGVRTATKQHLVSVTSASSPPTNNPPAPPPNNPPTGARDTTLTLSGAATGSSNTFTVTLTETKSGSPLSGQPVQIEFRNLTGSAYAVKGRAVTNATGKATFALSAAEPGFYRAQFAGNATFQAASSREMAASAGTMLKAAKWSTKGLKATLKTSDGRAVPTAALRLQKKAGSKWKTIKTVKTTKAGVAKVRISVRAKTVFRFVYRGSSAYRAHTSGAVTLK